MNRSSLSSQDPIRLPISYTPSNNDVIVGTSSEAKNHVGNRHLLTIVSRYSAEYSNATSKAHKGRIISQIIEDATIQSPTGTPFVKCLNGYWYTVEYDAIRGRVSQCMRNVLHSKYRSSRTAKRQRRVQNYRYYDDVVHVIMQRRGNFISERMGPLFAQVETNSRKSEDEVCELFTQANTYILESLKSLSLISTSDS